MTWPRSGTGARATYSETIYPGCRRVILACRHDAPWGLVNPLACGYIRIWNAELMPELPSSRINLVVPRQFGGCSSLRWRSKPRNRTHYQISLDRTIAPPAARTPGYRNRFKAGRRAINRENGGGPWALSCAIVAPAAAVSPRGSETWAGVRLCVAASRQQRALASLDGRRRLVSYELAVGLTEVLGRRTTAMLAECWVGVLCARGASELSSCQNPAAPQREAKLQNILQKNSHDF